MAEQFAQESRSQLGPGGDLSWRNVRVCGSMRQEEVVSILRELRTYSNLSYPRQ